MASKKELRARIADLEEDVQRLTRRAADAEEAARDLRASGRRTSLQMAREAIRDYGTPPPGEGTHPLQGHRDSMG